MQKLEFLADNLLWVLSFLLLALIAGIIAITLWLCTNDPCVITDWLQVWVEIWGFIFATTTFLAAWIAANRKPNLKFIVTSHEDPSKPISKLATILKQGERTSMYLHTDLENASPEPARFFTLEIELQSPTDQIDWLPPNFPWTTLVGLHVNFPTLGTLPGHHSPTATRYSAGGGSNLIIYARDTIEDIADITISTQGQFEGATTDNATTSIVPKLHEQGLTDLQYTLLLRALSDKRTTEKRIPLTVHLQPK